VIFLQSLMSNVEPVSSAGDADIAEHSISHHSLRKRHSPNSSASLKKEEATSVSSSTGSAVKLRKVAASSPSQTEEPSSSKSRTLGPKRNNELKYLTNFFPDRDAPQILTRSKIKQGPHVPPAKESSADEPSGSRTSASSSKEKQKQRIRAFPSSSGSSSQRKPVDMDTSPLVVKTDLPADGSDGQPLASVLKFADDALHRSSAHYMQSSSSSLLTRQELPSSSSMRFDLSTLTNSPSVIMSGSESSSLQTSIAQLAAAVAGASGDVPGASSAPPGMVPCSSSAGSSSSSRATSNAFGLKTNAPMSFSKSQPMNRASAFLGSLVPRMQHLLGGMGSGNAHIHSSE
jgi:hypothetical protein